MFQVSVSWNTDEPLQQEAEQRNPEWLRLEGTAGGHRVQTPTSCPGQCPGTTATLDSLFQQK